MSEESKLAEKLKETNTETVQTEEGKKFTEEELKQLGKIQEDYIKNQTSFGQLKIAKIRLNQEFELMGEREAELEKQFKDIQKSELEFMNSITEKYGDGSLNPRTGVFTPNKSK